MSGDTSTWLKLFTRFIVVMLGARHTTSWTKGQWSKGDREGPFFLYFTVDADKAERAERALRRANLLCNEALDGPQSYSSTSDEEVRHESEAACPVCAHEHEDPRFCGHRTERRAGFHDNVCYCAHVKNEDEKEEAK